MRRPLFVAALVALSAAALPHDVAADNSYQQDEVDKPSLTQLVLTSDVVVVGKITRTTEVERDNDLADISFNHKRRYTAVIAQITVDETLRGDPNATVKFTYPREPRVQGEPTYDMGQDGVWLLRRSDRPGEYLANDPGRLQPRDFKEQIRAILASATTQKIDSGSGE